MNDNPFRSPQVPPGRTQTQDQSKLQKDLANAIKARKYTLLAIPVVGTMTALQYSGFISTERNFLPNWFGLVALAIAVIQLPLLSMKISKLESALSKK